jgi:hypothetical protein
MDAPACSGRAAQRVVAFNGWRCGARDWPVGSVGDTWFDVVAVAEVFAGGSYVMQAMDHTNPANSRAIAVTMTGVGLPFAIIRR